MEMNRTDLCHSNTYRAKSFITVQAFMKMWSACRYQKSIQIKSAEYACSVDKCV